MSTQDVPGANPVNGDDLHAGCWAEHSDGSMIFVESGEGGRVIYSLFDLTSSPPDEYRDSMPEKGFKDMFTKTGWTWHDKTPFPWDKVIKSGVSSGQKPAHIEHLISAAERVGKKRNSLKRKLDLARYRQFTDTVTRKGGVIVDKLQRAIAELRA